MKPALVFALLCLGCVPTVAQSLDRVMDLNGLGWGRLGAPEPVETDGNLLTTEWLIENLDTGLLRVVREQPFCAGPWFNPRQSPFQSVTVKRVGMLHKLFVRNALTPGETIIVSLETPSCGG